MLGVARMLDDQDGSLSEIVYCRATKCNHNVGHGKCNIVHRTNGDDKISINLDGVCVNFMVG